MPTARGTELPQYRFLATLHFADASFRTYPPMEHPLAAFTTKYAENNDPLPAPLNSTLLS